MSSFVHLHVHTQFSLLQASIRPKKLCKKVSEMGMEAIAISDYGNLFGAVDFYKAAKGAGIRPVIGCELYVAPDGTRDKRGVAKDLTYRLVLLAQDAEGYTNLCRLISIGYYEGMYQGRPRIRHSHLMDNNKGLIALSSDYHGEISRFLLEGDEKAAEQAALEYAQIFKGTDSAPGFYLQLNRHAINEEKQEQVIQGLSDIGQRHGIPMVAANGCLYLTAEEARAHEVLVCIGLGKTIHDPERPVFGNDYYLKSPEEMAALFPDYPEALSNTVDISRRCDFDFKFGDYHFPVYEPPEGHDITSYFIELAEVGLVERLKVVLAREDIVDKEATIALYEERLKIELDIVIQMGFPAYFLIVADFINYAKNEDIPVGPGRGSAAGSLVAFAMRITDIDPMSYDLLFERFLNPERVSMPDVDVDFCQERRHEVIQYVGRKYGGRDKVCQIITFGKLQAKACIKDVGRVLDMPFNDVDRISKLIPNVLNISLGEAIDQEPRLRELIETEDRVARLLTFAQSLEGLTRHHSIHAAGVVISDLDLTEYLPIATGADNEVVTQFDMKYLDDIGLVKFDFLGLKTLTQINNCVAQVERNHGKKLDMLLVPVDDLATYELLGRGDTVGVFQLESSGMREIVIKLKPEVFPDVIALVALYRPGPLKSGMVQEFIDRKHGRKDVAYPHPLAEDILKDTYGVIVYQEQVMLLAQRLAGYSLGEADLLRRAMGKKKLEAMQEQAVRFESGAKDNDIPTQKANEIFKLMEKFAEYGFNKSHSAAYGFVSYQTAWLKAHYRPEFMASLMTIDAANTDKVLNFINDSKESGIEILPPDVDHSRRKFIALKDGSIRYGFCAIKSIGAGAIDSIEEAQEKGPFKGIYDFCERVDLKRVNRKVLENLIKSGAFDRFGKRSSHIQALPTAYDSGVTKGKERASGQTSLFGSLTKSVHPPLADINEFPETRRLELEKAALGLYLSGHPMEAHMDRIRKLTSHTTRELASLEHKTEVTIAGVVGSCKQIMTKKGARMAFINLEDIWGGVETVVFSDAFGQSAHLLLDDAGPILVVKASVDAAKGEDEVGVKLIAREISALHEVEAKSTRRVDIILNIAEIADEQMKALKQTLEANRGKIPSYLHLKMEDGVDLASASLSMPPLLRVRPSPQLKRDVELLFGSDVIFFNSEAPKLR